jgi:cytoskeletal protein CcmA (bactofilin family)
LFHSCTFITPGVDAITMTNGVRVEWLNSFTYFADRGLYAVDGLTGRTGQDGSTVIYGAELRSIGSANVYGNYGAVADGAGTLMYLIQHNMAYIGTGANAENDPSLAIQANEVVESNSGQIHYVTTDHTGSFRIGDNFFIDFETGSTNVDLSSLTADSLTGLVITNAGDTTTIDGRFIETGNFRISGNLIQSLSGNINLDSATNTTNLNNNTNINGTLDVTGNFTFDGALSLAGNESGDAVTFNVELEQDFNPNETMAFKLGSPSKEWLAAYLNRIEVGDFSIYDNVIETKTSNADLEIRANGTGNILIPDSATIDNSLSIAEISSFADVNIIGALGLTGNLDIAGNKIISNDLTISQNLTVGASAQFEEILVDGNVITTTRSNADLELRASGTGNIVVGQNVVAEQDLSFDNGSFGNNLTVDLNLTADNTNISNIEINDNYIETTSVNADLELKSTQNISAPDSVELGRDLTVSGTTDLQSLSITGLLDHTGDKTQTGNYTIAGELTVDNVYLEDNFITTLNLNGDLNLSATGVVSAPANNVEITNNLTVSADTDLQSTSITGSLLHTGNTAQTGNYDLAGELIIDDIYVEDNFITSTGTDQNLELQANGNIVIPTNNVVIVNDLTTSNNTDLQNVSITGTLIHTGNVNQIGNAEYAGDNIIDGAITVNSAVQFENIQLNDNTVQTTLTNSDLELRASGTGRVKFDETVRISQDLFAASITSGDIIIDQDLELNEIVIPPSIIEIDDNFISTRISNADLDLRAAGTGNVVVPSNNVVIDNDLTVNGNTDLKDTTINGTLSQIGIRTQTGNYNLTGNLLTSGLVTITAATIIDDIKVDGNKLESLSGNLILGASGTRLVTFPNLDIDQNIISSTLTTAGIVIDGTFALEELESSTDIQIFDNVITTTNSNSNLELRTSGTGDIALQDLKFNSDRIFTETNDIIIVPNNNLIIDATGALELPAGTSEQRIAAEDIFLDFGVASSLLVDTVDGGDALTVFNSQSTVYNAGGAQISTTGNTGDLRFNTDELVFEGFGNAVISFGGVYSDNRLTNVLAHPTNNSIIFSVNSIQVANVNNDNITLHGLQVEDILINNNVITTTVSNSDLELRTAGLGEFVIDNLTFISNKIDTSSSSLVISNTGNGYTKLAGTFGVVLPTGTEAERPVLDPEVGDTRFNTDDEVLEVWDGSTYVAAAGTSATISQTEFNDLIFEYTLIFG